MLVFTPLDPKVYLQAATNMTYYRLFPLLMEDFVTRADMKQLMMPTNLLIASAMAGPVPVTGTVQPIFTGDMPLPGSYTLLAQIELKKQSGGVAIDAALGALGNM